MSAGFLYVGNWSFEAKPEKGKGITIYSYNEENGELRLLETIDKDVAAGQLYLDEKNLVLYSNDECGERRNEIGGGGYLRSYRIDPVSGKLTLMNVKESLSPEPAYLCLDKSGRYLVAAHVADPFHVTKIVKNEDGSFSNTVLFDDTTLVMFRINGDGSIGEACDVAFTEGTGGKGENSQFSVDPLSGHMQLVQVISRLHCLVSSPDGEIMAACDKGMDRVYIYKIDREKEKLIRLSVWDAPEVACFPRYCAFHPTRKVLYVNNENLPVIHCFHYDSATGALERFDKAPLFDEDPGLIDGRPAGAQDIMVHPNGRTLYCSVFGLNLIIVCSLDEEGKISVVQRVPSRGVLPRGLVLSPDRRFLFSGNMVSGDITVFRADEDGLLTDTGITVPAVSPSALKFI